MGIYIDDVYLAHSIGNVLDVIDVERIEILRGPQGTLFGRNTIGGAVRVVTRKPDEEFGGLVELVGGEYNRQDIKGQFNVPLKENLFMRISGLSQNRDGYVDRPFLNGKTGDKDNTSFVGQLRWLPNDRVTADLMLTYTQDRSNGAAVVLLKGSAPPGSQPDTFRRLVAPALNPVINDFLMGPEFVGFDGNNCCIDYSDTNIRQSLDTWGGSFTLNWDISDELTFKSITGYRDLETFFGRDGDHLPEVQQVELNFYTEYWQISQEFQLIGSSFEDRLDWIAGAYYYYEEGRSDDFVQLVTLDLKSGGAFKTEDYSIFGQGTFHITDKLDLTAGLRYTDETKKAIIDGVEHQVVSAFLGGGPFKVPDSAAFQVVPPGTYPSTTTETDPYLNLSYQWTDGLMTYVSYAEGFKGGGVQVRNGPLPLLPQFGPEFAKVYEIGAKWALLDGRLNLSGAAFRTDYTDLQITAVVIPPDFGGQAVSVVTNAGDAEIDGFELEFSALPTPNLVLSGGVAYLDAKYTRLNPGTVTLDNKLPNAPKWQLNASASYYIHSGVGIFTPRIDWSYSSEQFNDADNNEILRRDAAHMVNLSFAYETNDGLWSGSLFLTNALDEQVILAGFDGGNYADGAVSRPREWGVRLRRSF